MPAPGDPLQLRSYWSVVLPQRGRSGVDSPLGEAGPAGGLDGGQHRPDVVVGGVTDGGEPVDESVVEYRPGGRVVGQGDQEVLDLVLEPVGQAVGGMLQVGKAAGMELRAREVVAGLRERLASVQAAVQGLERPRVFALEWGDPPFNGGHWVPEMLQVAGAEALLACPGAPSVRVTWAQIAAAAPQIVVFMPCGYDLQAAVEEARRTLLARTELAGVEAIVAVDASAYCSRPGPRLVDGVEILAAALHPGQLPPPPAGTAVRLGPRPHQ